MDRTWHEQDTESVLHRYPRCARGGLDVRSLEQASLGCDGLHTCMAGFGTGANCAVFAAAMSAKEEKLP